MRAGHAAPSTGQFPASKFPTGKFPTGKFPTGFFNACHGSTPAQKDSMMQAVQIKEGDMIEHDACKAVYDRRLVTFYYDGSLRTVEPHAVGYDHDGDLTLSAWQTSGESGQGFRDFHLRKAIAFAIAATSFSGPRPEYRRIDRRLSRILCQL